MKGVDEDDISQGGLNPAGFTPNYGWPVKSSGGSASGGHGKKPRRSAFGWILTVLLVAGLVVLFVWMFRGLATRP